MPGSANRKWHDRIIRVIVADEFSLFRRQLIVALERAPDIEVMVEASDTDELITHSTELAPDVVLIGTRMPSVGGTRVTAALREVIPAVEVALFVDAVDEREFARAARAGVAGFLPRQQAARLAAGAVRLLVTRRPALVPAAAEAVVAEFERLEREAASVQALLPAPVLSDRERGVLVAVAGGDGRGTEAPADAGSGPSVTDVKIARNALLKLERHARAEAALVAGGAGPSGTRR